MVVASMAMQTESLPCARPSIGSQHTRINFGKSQSAVLRDSPLFVPVPRPRLPLPRHPADTASREVDPDNNIPICGFDNGQSKWFDCDDRLRLVGTCLVERDRRTSAAIDLNRSAPT